MVIYVQIQTKDGKRMVNHRHDDKYVKKILELMPDEKSIQAKDLLDLATKVNSKNSEAMGRDTLYYYLKTFNGTFWNKLPKTRKRQRETFYLKNKNADMVIVSRKMVNERINSLLKELPKEVEKVIESELNYMRKHGGDLSEHEARNWNKQIAGDEAEISRALSFVLLREAFKLARETRGVQKEDYMNDSGKVLSKAQLEALQKTKGSSKFTDS